MTITEIFAKAGMNTLLGMGTVFVMLVLISCIISLFRYIPQPGAKKKAEPAKAAQTVSAETAFAQTENDVLIAVISAAIAAASAAEGNADGEDSEAGTYIVRSIQRRGK